MATQTAGLTLPKIASSNVTALTYSGNPPVYSSGGIPQFSVVCDDSANTGKPDDVKLCTNATTFPLGVSQNGPAVTAGGGVTVQVNGITKCVASAAITVGSLVQCTSSGQVVTATAAAATSVWLIGIALTAAAQAGDLISVELRLATSQIVNA